MHDHHSTSDVWKEYAAHEVTHSVAHYLTTLLELSQKQGYARVSDVARELDLARGSVSSQMKQLKEKGLVTEDENKVLFLSERGETIAKEIIHNRAVLISFFRDVLGVNPERSEIDACKMEHLLSRESAAHLLSLVKFLQGKHPAAQEFLSTFRCFELDCKGPEDCPVCQDECSISGIQDSFPV
jgi:DtxR family Mn-dependent transcriptional regulator